MLASSRTKPWSSTSIWSLAAFTGCSMVAMISRIGVAAVGIRQGRRIRPPSTIRFWPVKKSASMQ